MSLIHRLSPQWVMIIAYFAYATSDLGIKMTAGFMNAFEVVFLRSSFAIMIVICIYNKRLLSVIKPIRLREICLAFISLSALLCVVESLKTISLITFAILNLSIPIFALILSRIFLKEQLTFEKTLSLLLGFLGAFLVVFKGVMELNVGMLWAILSAFLNSAMYVFMKKLNSSRESIFLSYLIVCFLGTLFFVDLHNLIPVFKNNDIWWLSLSSVAQLLAFYALIVGVQKSDLGHIVHLEYTSVIFGAFYSFIFFNTYPTLLEVLGSLIIFAGIIIKIPQKKPLGIE